MKTTYEYIVIGVGGIGSAAAYRLAREAGPEVLALEQFRLGHDHGASQDHSRIIRLSYHDPAYTALTPHTYTAWTEVEQESGVQLVLKTGGLELEPADGTSIAGFVTSMRAADIPFEELDADEVMYRWPQYRLTGGERALYQADGGLVDAGKGIAVHVALARAHGATVLDQTPVRRLRAAGDHVEVITDAGAFAAGKVVIAVDAWTNCLLASFGLEWPLTITQEQVTYFATPNLRDFAPDRFPIFIWHGRDYYGFPVYGEVATKAAIDPGGKQVTTDTRTFEPDPEAEQELIGFLERHIPGFLGPVLRTKTCLYTMPPDRNFTIDTLPGEPRVVVAQGAAHAYKFAALLGQVLADLAVRGRTDYPIAPFCASRPALTDPAFPVSFHLG